MNLEGKWAKYRFENTRGRVYCSPEYGLEEQSRRA